MELEHGKHMFQDFVEDCDRSINSSMSHVAYKKTKYLCCWFDEASICCPLPFDGPRDMTPLMLDSASS